MNDTLLWILAILGLVLNIYCGLLEPDEGEKWLIPNELHWILVGVVFTIMVYNI